MSDETVEESGRYPFREIEKTWQVRWADASVHRAENESSRPKHYVLVMFPYPSGSGLHVGHCKNYVPGDVAARFKSMQGFNVLNPMGWDAFGQPAEQDAIKNGVNPRQIVPKLAEIYKKQLDILGVSYDWSREINTTSPEYYRWNQWIFLKLFEKGLAYRDFAPVNWCDNDKTVLANEEVVDGKCWRCGSVVQKRPLAQWKFKITAYADKLIEGLDKINWAEGVKTQQREWIGRSEGAEVDFAVMASPNPDNGEPKVENSESGSPLLGLGDKITVFTTRPDTLWGATFMVLSPEHPLVSQITTPEQKSSIESYISEAAKKSEADRTDDTKEKTGVFTGAYAVNPVNDAKVPIWIADYVLTGYGTGAIMAVPAHDQRDFEFARKYNLEIKVVVQPEGEKLDGATLDAAWPGDGTMASSGVIDGIPAGKGEGESVKAAIVHLATLGAGRGKIQFRLRDWLISRQRYWGTPIPIVHCLACGIVPVPESELPVVLPDIEEYRPGPDGRSPLSTVPEFVNCACPKCGGKAERETDTMAGAMDSSWYFLRFADPKNSERAFDTKIANDWMPIDTYIGGREHAVGHLLYCRFFTKFLHELGLCDADEPAASLKNQGMLNAYTPILSGTDKAIKPEEFVHYPREDWIAAYNQNKKPIPAERYVELDGVKSVEPIEVEFSWLKMSKSKKTAVTPDEMAEKYGADALRLYILFEAPFESDIQWSEERMNGTFRFLGRVWDIIMNVIEGSPSPDNAPDPSNGGPDKESEVRALRRKTHQSIAKVTDDLENFRFNTAVSALMILSESLRKFVNAGGTSHPAAREAAEALVLLLAPMAPHLADELWSRLGAEGFLYRTDWPKSDPALAAEDELTVVVQINGKLRDKLVVPAGTSREEQEAAALASEKIQSDLSCLTVRKVIVVPGKLVNIVAN